ncbi:molybdopterin molybdotransferase MoeA [Pseudovibrio exalbescens]|uniref:molybdopterin molybdotransferase MoeA n=1 Tax=Pseudovibrio exalbescens TaxID=197461 RepID=UPI002365D77D|nr:gephyrin-like molybdotransferase Glp [Pseudovibrio exalbescens]MDD7911614.1 molybdopterin molybdotransferase MoeA [Pseudovibrio exalbescens]
MSEAPEPSNPPLDFTRALEHALNAAEQKPLQTDHCPIEQSLGRVVASDQRARSDLPAFDNSAMDGFALPVGAARSKPPHQLKVIGTIAAGAQEGAGHPVSGECLRIFTGAPVPPWCESVVPVEACDVEGDTITIKEHVSPGANIRCKGEYLKPGDILITKGTPLEPRHIGQLVANGFSAIEVYQPLRVAIFSTGDELATAKQATAQAQIHDSNRPMLIAYAKAMGAQVVDLGILGDDAQATTALFEKAKDKHDLLISSGAVSVGPRDFIKDAVIAAGGTIESWRVAIKPGKPILFARLGQLAYTGLPGNPLAALIGFEFFVRPQIQKMSGAASPGDLHLQAVSGFEWQRRPGRTEFFPVRVLGINEVGLPVLARHATHGAASLHEIAQADGIGMVSPSTTQIVQGTTLMWRPFPSATLSPFPWLSK